MQEAVRKTPIKTEIKGDSRDLRNTLELSLIHI